MWDLLLNRNLVKTLENGLNILIHKMGVWCTSYVGMPATNSRWAVTISTV